MKRKVARRKENKEKPDSFARVKNMSLKDMVRETMNLSRKAGYLSAKKCPSNTSYQANSSVNPRRDKENIGVHHKAKCLEKADCKQSEEVSLLKEKRKLRARVLVEKSNNCHSIARKNAVNGIIKNVPIKLNGKKDTDMDKAKVGLGENQNGLSKRDIAAESVYTAPKFDSEKIARTSERILNFSGLTDAIHKTKLITNENIYDYDSYVVEEEPKQGKKNATHRTRKARRQKSQSNVTAQNKIGRKIDRFCETALDQKKSSSMNSESKINNIKSKKNVKDVNPVAISNKNEVVSERIEPKLPAALEVVLIKPIRPLRKKVAAKRKLNFGTSGPDETVSLKETKQTAHCAKSQIIDKTKATGPAKSVLRKKQNHKAKGENSALATKQQPPNLNVQLEEKQSKTTPEKFVLSDKNLAMLSPVRGITSFHELSALNVDDACPFSINDYVTSTPDKANEALKKASTNTRSLASILNFVNQTSKEKDDVPTEEAEDVEDFYRLFYDHNENKQRQSLLGEEEICPVKKSRRNYASKSFKVTKKVAPKKNKKVKAEEKKNNAIAKTMNNHFEEIDKLEFLIEVSKPLS